MFRRIRKRKSWFHWGTPAVDAATPEGVIFVAADDSETEVHLADDSPARSILALALEAKLDISHSCGGHGTCGTCRVFIQEGAEGLEPRGEIEMEAAEARDFKSHERLACQTLVLCPLKVRIP